MCIFREEKDVLAVWFGWCYYDDLGVIRKESVGDNAKTFEVYKRKEKSIKNK